jgi:hypothetical protein
LIGNTFAKGFKHSKETKNKVSLKMQQMDITKNNTSGYRGVSFFKRENKWVSRIYSKGKLLYIGYFDNKEDAARSRDKKALEIFGPKCYLNFPLEANLYVV